jgi:hypothetical protein
VRRRLSGDLLVAFFCLAFAALPACNCSGTTGDICTQNSDCSAGATCINGACAKIPECSRSAECDAGSSCISGQCAVVGNPCTNDSACATGASCSTHHVCAPPSCTSAIDCGLQQVCIAGSCAPVGTPPPDCDAGENCVFPPPPPDSGPTCVNLQCAQVACADGGTTTLTGQVFDPSGQVPLYNALVYVPNGQVQPFDAGVSCDICGGGTSGDPLVIALTDATGSYTLKNVPAGVSFPLVMQIGKWRRQVTIPAITACGTSSPSDVNLERFPKNQSEGDIPQFAIATGSADAFECLLVKMLDASEFTRPDGGGRVHMYVTPQGSPAPLQLPGGSPPATSLWGDTATLANYDVVLLPCEGSEYRKPDAGIANLVSYTGVGGRLFVTHYSYVWTAFNAPFNTVANWVPDAPQNHNPGTPPGSPTPFLIDSSFPKGLAFQDWLSNVGALTDPSPTCSGASGQLCIHDPRDDVGPVTSFGTRWVYGPNVNNTTTPVATEHLTWNTPVNPPPQPDGDAGVQCGRVVFSDFHVTATGRNTGSNVFPAGCVSAPMTGQEKALVFMLFDVSSCVQSDQTPPTVCPALGQGCSTTQACCNGLSCLGQSLAPCAAGESCTCQVPIN